MIRTALAALSLSLFPLSASAQQAPMLTSVSPEMLEGLVARMEGHSVAALGELGATSVRAVSDTGLNYVLVGTSCDEAGTRCGGLDMKVYFAVESVDYERLNMANLNWSAASTWYDPDAGALGVSTYMILDYGQTIENVEFALKVLLSIAPESFKYVMGRTEQ